MNVVTLTLNPAFDVHLRVDNLKIFKENYATEFIKQAGGKGVNISRALVGYGVCNTAFCVMGKDNSREFLNELKKDNVNCTPIIKDGRIRENITVHSLDGETRISLQGLALDEEIFSELISAFTPYLNSDTVLTFTGRLPKGVSTLSAIEFLKRLKEKGVRLIVDCNSFSADDLLDIKPFLIKPNEQEIEQLIGDGFSEEDLIQNIKTFCEKGIENVVVSLGSNGFFYCGKDGMYKAEVPKITPVSTIGAGDSLVAGFVAGLVNNEQTEQILKLAASFGTAACLEEGTTPPKKEKIANILNQVKIIKL